MVQDTLDCPTEVNTGVTILEPEQVLVLVKPLVGHLHLHLLGVVLGPNIDVRLEGDREAVGYFREGVVTKDKKNFFLDDTIASVVVSAEESMVGESKWSIPPCAPNDLLERVVDVGVELVDPHNARVYSEAPIANTSVDAHRNPVMFQQIVDALFGSGELEYVVMFRG